MVGGRKEEGQCQPGARLMRGREGRLWEGDRWEGERPPRGRRPTASSTAAARQRPAASSGAGAWSAAHQRLAVVQVPRDGDVADLMGGERGEAAGWGVRPPGARAAAAAAAVQSIGPSAAAPDGRSSAPPLHRSDSPPARAWAAGCQGAPPSPANEPSAAKHSHASARAPARAWTAASPGTRRCTGSAAPAAPPPQTACA